MARGYGGFVGGGGLFAPLPSLLDAISAREDRNMAQLGGIAQITGQMQQRRLAEQEFQMRQQEAEDKLAQRAALESAIGQLDPQLQPMVRAYPAILGQLFRGQQQPTLTELADPDDPTKSVKAFVSPGGGMEIVGGSPVKERAEKMSQAAQLLTEMGVPKGSPQWNKSMQDALRKETNFAPPIRIENYPAPIPVVDPATGKITLAQVGSQGSVKMTGLQPPPDRVAAQASKMPAEMQRMKVAIDSLDKGLSSYESELSSFNPRNPTDFLDPTKRAKFEALGADLKMQAKEANALGALTGPDVKILDQLMGMPTDANAIVIGRRGLQEKIGQARQAIARRRSALASQYPQQEAPAPEAKRKRFNPATGQIEAY